MWKSQEGKKITLHIWKKDHRPKRCSNEDWTFRPCVRRQTAASSVSQNLNATNQVSDLAALNVHSKVSAVSLFLNYQTYWVQSGFWPSLRCMNLPSCCSQPRWEQPLPAAIPIHVWFRETPFAYWHPPARQLGQRNEARRCSYSHQ